MTGASRIAFLFIGGVHHVFHTMPVACALARRAGTSVTVLTSDSETQATAAKVASDLGADLSIDQLKRPSLPGRLLGRKRAKLPLLWRNRGRLNEFDAIVVAECTSTALKRMGVRNPALICLPHGAGDRAISFEPRFRRFDRVLVAGSKTARRMAETGVEQARIQPVGYPKAEYLARRSLRQEQLFATDRPIILYNPHFRRHLSSLDRAEELVAAIVTRTDLNLIVAPHIRTFDGLAEEQLARWHALAEPGRVLVDTGSERMIDMSHVAAADLYLGDVSSQVYEFLLLSPRPCVFVNAHNVQWRGNLDYAFWQLGEVVRVEEVVEGLNAALSDPQAYAAAQTAAVHETFGELEGSAERAANAVLDCLAERS